MMWKKPKPPEEPKDATQSWLLTFNDLSTNLMVFFVLVFALSSIDIQKFKEFSGSFQSGMGVLHEGKKVSVKVVPPYEPGMAPQAHTPGEEAPEVTESDASNEAHEGPKSLLMEAVKALEGETGVTTLYDQGALRIRLQDTLLFGSGSAEISPAAGPLLGKIARILLQVPLRIRVEGHTDTMPIATDRFPSNWELSIARAVNVLHHLIEPGGIKPERLCAVGYGETRPLFSNDSPETRRVNRRVEIVVTEN